MTNENWFLTFFTRTNNQFSHEHCARPKKTPPLYCWLLALWSLWKWTVPRWIEPYFPILLISNLGEKTLDSLHIFCYLSNVTCPQFRSRMFCASQEGMTNCIPMPTRAENTLRWNLPKICSTKKPSSFNELQNSVPFFKSEVISLLQFFKWFPNQFPVVASLCIKQCMSHSYNNY